MLRKSAMVALVVTAALALPAWAQERERAMPLRSFDRFELESETVDGFWAEGGAFYQRTKQSGAPELALTDKLDAKATTAFARLAYGGSDKWETDLLIPYHFMDADFKSGDTTSDLANGNGIGDIQLSGKYVPVRGQVLDLGIGALLSLPSGDDEKGFGAGEFGGMPFVTGTIHLAIAELRTHVGAEFFTGSNRDGGGRSLAVFSQQASDRIVYGFDIIAPIGKYVALRNEFAGADYKDLKDSPKVMSYQPGIDVRIPIGDLDVVLRPTGAFGLTESAADWGVGGSIVVTSPTMRAPVGAAGPGGVTIE